MGTVRIGCLCGSVKPTVTGDFRNRERLCGKVRLGSEERITIEYVRRAGCVFPAFNKLRLIRSFLLFRYGFNRGGVRWHAHFCS
jgi:hypothetical protein